MKFKIISVAICFTFCTLLAASGQTLKNGVDSLSCAFGIIFGKNIQSGGFTTVNAEIFGQTVQKVLHNEVLGMSPEAANAIIQAQFQKNQQARYEKNITAGRTFLAANKVKPDVVTLPSGLQYKVITQGTGAKPLASNKVSVHYHGTLIDGTVFDSSKERGQPAEFGVTQVIAGWTEALQLMPVGSKWMLYIPSELAYGERPRPGGPIEPYMTLIFEVELLAIIQ